MHFWNRGYKSWEVLEQMTQPVADFPCYVCGEAYSTNQTWVEGALQTAEIVLAEALRPVEAGVDHDAECEGVGRRPHESGGGEGGRPPEAGRRKEQ